MKTDAEIRLEIVSLFYRIGRPEWNAVADEAQLIYDWVKQGTQVEGPAPANAAPIPGETGSTGPGGIPGQAAQRNQTSRNNPTGRA